jgi:hypothetical protein
VRIPPRCSHTLVVQIGKRLTKGIQHLAREATDRIAANQSDEIVIWPSVDVLRDSNHQRPQALRSVDPIAKRIDVSPERQFVGFDAYKQILALHIDIVLLYTPPAFRPLQYTAEGKTCKLDRELARTPEGPA